MFCGNLLEEIESLLKTVLLYLGGTSDRPYIPIVGSHTPPYMEKANVEFVQEAMGITIPPRTTYEVEIDESQIKSGDFFLNLRLDGLDPLIMYGTGSIGGHCTMALWIDDELYVVEA